MTYNCVLAWHFASTQMRDGTQLAAPGGVERYDGKLEMCASGLHASRRLIDALKYAPGTLLRRVECIDPVEDHDKMVCRERRVLWECDMTAALRLFARRCALDVAHLWRRPMPDIVQEFLMTGRNARAAARTAAAWAAEARTAAAWEAAPRAAEWAAWAAAPRAAALKNKQERRLVAYAQAARAGAFQRIPRPARTRSDGRARR